MTRLQRKRIGAFMVSPHEPGNLCDPDFSEAAHRLGVHEDSKER